MTSSARLSLAKIATAAPLLLLLASCSSLRHSTMPPDTDASRPLVAPQALGSEQSASQIVRGAFGPREMSLNCVVTVHGETMTIVGLTAMGIRAFTLRYDGHAVQVDNDLPVPPQLTPQRLLADVQLVYWPLGVLRAPFASAGLQLTEPFAGTRRLRRAGQLIAEVHYDSSNPWRGRSWLVNLEYGYTLNIESTSLPAQ